MSLLNEIIRRTEADLDKRRLRVPFSELRRRVEDMPPTKSLKDALRSKSFSIIGEIKHRSPLAGEMNPRNVADALDVYNESPVITAISVLTDEPFFGGSLDQLKRVREGTSKPILRKDFIIDEYQVWEARAFGADAVLLMSEVHKRQPSRLAHLYEVANSLGLQALVELGMGQTDPKQRQAAIVPLDAEIWGINSRDFHSSRFKFRMHTSRLLSKLVTKDLMTSRSRHERLRSLIPHGKIAVAESGIHQPREIDALVRLGYNAALIGTAFLKSSQRISEVVSAFAKHIANMKYAGPDIAHSDLAWR